MNYEAFYSMEVMMLHTFKAILRGNSVEWMDETPELGDQPIAIHITILEENLSSDTASRGQKMAEILEKIAASHAFAGVDPIAWQREVRQEQDHVLSLLP